MASSSPVAIANDPRFHLARTLVTTGKSDEGAIDAFASLLEECRSTFGDSSLDAALCQYEYGNALFRAAAMVEQKRCDVDATEVVTKESDDEKKPPATVPLSSAEKRRAIAAAAAEKRSLGEPLHQEGAPKSPISGPPTKKLKTSENSTKEDAEEESNDEGNSVDDNGEPSPDENDESEKEEDDVVLALEMMETSFALLASHAEGDEISVNYAQNGKFQSKHDTTTTTIQTTDIQRKWALEQLPRVLTGIGDVHSFLGNHADAVDAYCRALPYREDARKQVLSNSNTSEAESSLEQLKRQRYLVEAHVLVAESLLACPEGKDVMRSESNGGSDSDDNVLVKAEERIDFARGYYEKGREELQELVYQMGKMSSLKIDLSEEKEDICYLATMLMAVGNSLEEIDEKASHQKIASRKK